MLNQLTPTAASASRPGVVARPRPGMPADGVGALKPAPPLGRPWGGKPAEGGEVQGRPPLGRPSPGGIGSKDQVGGALKQVTPMARDGFDFSAPKASAGDKQHGMVKVEGLSDDFAGQQGQGRIKASDLEAFKQKVAQEGPPKASEGNLWGRMGQGAAELAKRWQGCQE